MVPFTDLLDSWLGEFPKTPRFSPIRFLGAGGFGAVFEAFDHERQHTVALKVLRAATPAALYAFKREFRALADVHHQNLVSLYELFADGDRWYFTMELIPGVPLLEHVRPTRRAQLPVQLGPQDPLDELAAADTVVRPALARPRPPSPSDTLPELPIADPGCEEAKLRAVLPQIVAGVMRIHAAGLLHRDLKPGNVLVTDDGRVVLLDFGLVSELAASSMDTEGRISGTPAYMSPEHARGTPLSEASDWYSLGVVLYEALAGVLPHRGTHAMILYRKVAEPAAPILVLSPHTATDLAEVTMALLDLDPVARPSGPELLKRLGLDAEAPSARSSTLEHTVRPPFVGRMRQLATLDRALDAARSGRSVVLHVHGETGMGKSALIAHFLESRAHVQPDLLVLSGRCFEQESVPFKALDAAIDTLARALTQLPDAEVTAMIPREAWALARVFPVLQRVRAIGAASAKDIRLADVQELRRRAAGALRALLGRLADRRAVILHIDDLQWGDADSAYLLAELLRQPDAPALLFIAAYRSGDDTSSPLLVALDALRPSAPDGDDTRELVVGELEPEEALALARALVGGVDESSEARAGAIARESQGSPLFIDALAQHEDTPAPGLADDSSPSLQQVLLLRIEHLPPEERRLLSAIAVAGGPIDVSVAALAAQIDGDENALLRTLRGRRLIRTTAGGDLGTVEPYHDHVRVTVTEDLASSQRRAIHRRLAEALTASGTKDPETLARHWADAGEPHRAAGAALEAADRAASMLAFDRAARLYTMVLELGALEGQKLHEVRVELADALANAGRGEEAAQMYLTAAEARGGLEAIDLSRRAAEKLLISGRMKRGLEVTRRVVQALGMRYPKSNRSAFWSVLLARASIFFRGLGHQVRPESEIPELDRLRIDACWSIAIGLSFTEWMVATAFQMRHLRLALDAGDPNRLALALATEAGWSAAGGSKKAARTADLIRRATALAEESGDARAIGSVEFNAGMAAFLEGRTRDAVDRFDHALDILTTDCTGVTYELNNTRLWAVCALYWCGELDEVRRRLPALIEDAVQRRDHYALSGLRAYSYIAALADDDPERAAREAEESRAYWPTEGFLIPHFWVLVATTEIRLYRGAGREAWTQLQEVAPRAERSLLFQVQGLRLAFLSLRARAAIAAAVEGGSDVQDLLRSAESDARRMIREGAPWALALGDLYLGATHALRGQRRAALERLCGAHLACSSVGYHLHRAAALRARGLLLGGGRGETLVDEAEQWMDGQRIVSFDHITRLVAPGPWAPARPRA